MSRIMAQICDNDCARVLCVPAPGIWLSGRPAGSHCDRGHHVYAAWSAGVVTVLRHPGCCRCAGGHHARQERNQGHIARAVSPRDSLALVVEIGDATTASTACLPASPGVCKRRSPRPASAGSPGFAKAGARRPTGRHQASGAAPRPLISFAHCRLALIMSGIGKS